MTEYLVDLYLGFHTCPANPSAHTVDTIRRTITTSGHPGPCLTPVTIRCGTRTVQIRCGRHEPAHRQCGNCRTVITIRRTTGRLFRPGTAA